MKKIIVVGHVCDPLTVSVRETLEKEDFEVIVVDSLPIVNEPPPILECELFNERKYVDFDLLDRYEQPSVIYKPKRGKGKKGVKRRK